MFAGMLAFDVLDRLTGDWSVTNTDWFQGFYAAVIQVLKSFPCYSIDSHVFGGCCTKDDHDFVLHHHHTSICRIFLRA